MHARWQRDLNPQTMNWEQIVDFGNLDVWLAAGRCMLKNLQVCVHIEIIKRKQIIKVFFWLILGK